MRVGILNGRKIGYHPRANSAGNFRCWLDLGSIDEPLVGNYVVRTGGSCLEGSCECVANDGSHPDIVGWPPYHGSCSCYVESI